MIYIGNMILKRVFIDGKLSTMLNKSRLMSTRMFTNKKKEDIGPIGYLLLIIPVGALSLGVWQVKRRRWKLDLIEELESKTTRPAIQLPENLAILQSATMEYQRVIVKGEFLHDQEMYIRPRSLLCPLDGEASNQSGLFSSRSQSGGAFIVTPFKLADRDETILVNRGWVERNKMHPLKRQEGQAQGQIEITGIVRQSEKRLPLGPKPVPEEHPFWNLRDVEKMAEASGTTNVFIDACIDKSGGSRNNQAPIAGQTRITLRNEHTSYIVTWFSLSAATAFMWFRKFVKGRPVF